MKIISLTLGTFILISSHFPGIAEQLSSYENAFKRSVVSPLGLPKIEHPKDNPPNVAKIKLGRKLFFDKRLSRDNSISCATCHNPTTGFTQNTLKTPKGFKDRIGKRNTPTLYNTAFYHRLHQDGRETSFETQFLSPLIHPKEMASRSAGFVIEKIKWLPDYQNLFEKVFGYGPSVDRIGQALAAYQRTLISGNSRFDRWHFGKEKDALNEQEILGFKLFTGKAKCETCHSISETFALFTDQAFHDIGHGWEQDQKRKTKQERDMGRYEVTQDPLDKWRYRTPTLRNIVLTAPYMHDGQMKTLEDVVKFYNKGGAPHKGQDNRIEPMNLNKKEISALVAFLKTLTGDNIEEIIAESVQGNIMTK